MTTFVSPDVSEADLDWLNRFVDRGDPIAEPDHVVQLLCILKAVVAHSGVTGFPSTASDCFCHDRIETRIAESGLTRQAWIDQYWRNSGDEIRFIAKATARALAEAASLRDVVPQ